MEFFQNFLESLTSYLPGMLGKGLGALVILIIGWFIASAFSKLIYRLLKKTNWDDKLVGKAKIDIDSNKFISKLVYYLLMIVVLMVTLEMLGVSQVLDPLKNMVNEFMGFIPNLIAAGVIGFVGYIIATVVSSLVGLSGNLLDKAAERFGVMQTDRIVNVLRRVVFLVIFIPILIQALNALNMDSISVPATDMLSQFMGAIPKIFACAVIIAVFYFGGKYFSMLLGDLLKSIGTDEMSEKLHLSSVVGERSLSSLIANTVFALVVVLGVITGIERLEFARLTEILNNLLGITGEILFGLIILVLGNFISVTIYNMLNKGENNGFIANIARWASLFLFIFIGLSTMGVGEDIVRMGFGLTLGAVAVVIALAYGLGGREAAGKHMEDILSKFRKK